MNKKQNHIINIAKYIIGTYYKNQCFDKVLIAGCGSTDNETIAISKAMGAKKTLGIDINIGNKIIDSKIELQRQDLTQLDIDANKFNFIYSYHVLEHVEDPSKALIEMKRVLKDDGVIFIGFPNRNRIIGNMGTYHGYTFYKKIKQNFKDYQYRIKGQFKNEFGAHAGFTQKEFLSLTNDIFSNILCVRNDYFTKKYIHQKNLIKLLIKTGLSEFLFASNYFICKK